MIFSIDQLAAAAQKEVDSYFDEPVITVPRPDGLYPNLPFEEYLKLPFWSYSSLEHARKSAAHARAARLGGSKKPTDDMQLGSALHVAILEPDQVGKRIAVWIGDVRKGKVWEAFKNTNKGRIILTKNQFDQLFIMSQAVHASPFAKEILPKIIDVELSKIGTINGLRIKSRLDARTSDTILDIKKVQSADTRAFTRAVTTYSYDIQAALYCRMFDMDKFVFLCIENEPPCDVVPFIVSHDMLTNGGRKLDQCIETVRAAEKSGLWPGRSSTPVLLEPNPYDVAPEVEYEMPEPPPEQSEGDFHDWKNE